MELVNDGLTESCITPHPRDGAGNSDRSVSGKAVGRVGHNGRQRGTQKTPKRNRRAHRPAFKAKVALMALKGDRTLAALAALAQQFEVHPNQTHKIWPYLLRGLTINRANPVWALDTSYIPMVRGFVYLTAVVDWASRKVLTHRMAITMEATHAVVAREDVFAKYGQPEIVYTDQSSQFTEADFIEAVFSRGILLSMYSKAKLNAVAKRLDERPRKTLNFDTPADRFYRSVASTG